MDDETGIGGPVTEASPAGPNPGTGDDQPGAAEAITEGEKTGPILETLSARITIRYPAERSADDEAAAKDIDLTNAAVAKAIEQAIDDHIEFSINYTGFTVNVTVEKV